MRARCRRNPLPAAPILIALLAGWAGVPAKAAAVLRGGSALADGSVLRDGSALAAGDTACGEAAGDLDLAAVLAGEEQEPVAQAPPPPPGEPVKATGPPCTTNRQCPAAQFCEKPTGDCAGKGQCSARPRICPEFCLPVCGCDGKDYCNDCFAHAAGVNLKSASACKQAAPACKTNRDCPRGDFCAKPVGSCDGEGACVRRPTICPEVVDPVCGCDGKTYDNVCYAFRAGVDIKSKGKCP